MGFLYYMRAFWPLDSLLGLWDVPSVLRPHRAGSADWFLLLGSFAIEALFQKLSEDVLQCCTCPSCHRWMCLCKHGWESAAHSCSTYLSIYCRLQTRLLVHVGVPSDRNTLFWKEEPDTLLVQLQEENLVFHHCKLNRHKWLLMAAHQPSTHLQSRPWAGFSVRAPPRGWYLDAAFSVTVASSPGVTSEKIFKMPRRCDIKKTMLWLVSNSPVSTRTSPTKLRLLSSSTPRYLQQDGGWIIQMLS